MPASDPLWFPESSCFSQYPLNDLVCRPRVVFGFESEVRSFCGLFRIASLTHEAVERGAHLRHEVSLNSFGARLQVLRRFTAPRGRGGFLRDLGAVQEAHDEVTEQTGDRDPFPIRAMLEAISEIRIKPKADFSVHFHGSL